MTFVDHLSSLSIRFCCLLLFLVHTSTSSIPGIQDLFSASELKIKNHGKRDTLLFLHSDKHNVVLEIMDFSKPSGTVVVILKSKSQIQPRPFTFSNSSNQFYRGVCDSESKEKVDSVGSKILGIMERDEK